MTEETENTELENETEVTYEEPESQDEGKVKQASNEDELDSYSKGVQSRIKKLTERYRQEERDKAEAVRLSQQLIAENNKLKTRVKALDTGYLSEYGSRLESQTESAKRVYKEAYEAGDTDKMLEAQQALSNIAVQQQQYNTAKARAEQQAKMPVQQAAPVQQQQPQQQAAPVPDEKAVAWKDKNKWFGRDKIMTTAAYTIHQELVEEQGFDPNSDEYYSEVNRRMRGEFPHKFQSANKSGGGSQVASAGNSASRSTKSGRRSVKLSHSAVAIAKKLGVPLEEYAKYVKD
jgi:GH15 family glucan-1,4-alpha-glucosidase